MRRDKYHVQFHLPDEALPGTALEDVYSAKMPCEVDCNALAKQYSGISGSDIANAVFTAAVSAARDGEKVVVQKRFETAIQRCLAVKEANQRGQVIVSKRILSEDEVKEKLGAEGYNKDFDKFDLRCSNYCGDWNNCRFWNDLISFLKKAAAKGTAAGRRYRIWLQGLCEKTAGGS